MKYEKVYRIPLKQSITAGSFWAFLLSSLCLFLAVKLTILALTNIHNFFITPWWGHLLVIIFLLESWIIGLFFYTTFNYLTLCNDKMIVRNVFIPFYSREFYFNDLKSNITILIDTGTLTSRSPYSTRIVAFLKNGKKWPGNRDYFYLRLVDKQCLLEIASHLQQKGLDVKVSENRRII